MERLDGHEPVVLVAEDEPLVRMLAVEALQDAGFRVLEAHNGEVAFGLIRDGQSIDILITDVKMPGRTGYELAEAALGLRPDIKILLVTGYAQDPLPRKFAEAGIQLLFKPFDLDTFIAIAKQLLEAKRQEHATRKQ